MLDVRFFRGLPKSDIDVVVAAASNCKFPYETVVLRQGYPANRLCLLLKGIARCFVITPAGRKVYLLWLRPGELFGGASLLSQPSCFLASTELTKHSEALVWQGSKIRQLAQRYPKLLENGLSIANEYFVWHLANYLSVICHTARQRLANVLVTLASGIGQKSEDGIHLHITNEQLANTANVTTFTASRLLNAWQRAGIIAKSRGVILVRESQRLAQFR
jgi:CRP/FNR family transcriptional regulator, nitrogen oxide reductase regulator